MHLWLCYVTSVLFCHNTGEMQTRRRWFVHLFSKEIVCRLQAPLFFFFSSLFLFFFMIHCYDVTVPGRAFFHFQNALTVPIQLKATDQLTTQLTNEQTGRSSKKSESSNDNVLEHILEQGLCYVCQQYPPFPSQHGEKTNHEISTSIHTHIANTL